MGTFILTMASLLLWSWALVLLLQITSNEADEDSAGHWAGSQEMRGLLIHPLCDFG